MKFKRGMDHSSGYWGKGDEAKRVCKKGRRSNDVAAIEEGENEMRLHVDLGRKSDGPDAGKVFVDEPAEIQAGNEITGKQATSLLAELAAEGQRRDEADDALAMLAWIEQEKAYVSPHGNPGEAGTWHVHHLGRDRLYNGPTAKVAISNAILGLDAYIPPYELKRLTGEEFVTAIPESLAREKGML